MYTILLVAHTILVLFLIALVLLQRTDSDGLSGLGGGGNQFLTGRAKGSIITRSTAILAAAFMATSLILAIMAGNMNKSSIVDEIVNNQNIPAELVDEKPENLANPKNPANLANPTNPAKSEIPAVPKGE